MILTLLGKLCDAESLAASDTYAGYCLDLASATQRLPGASLLWLALSTNVAADYTTGDETYEFVLRTGTGTDGTDINAGALSIISTTVLNGDNARLDASGDWILRCTMPMECSAQRYVQLYYDRSGTTTSITIDFSISPSKPRTDYNIQVENSNVSTP